MPTPLHDIFCARVVSEISTQLGRFQKSDKPFADFARKIDHRSTTRIWLPNDTKSGEQTRSERNPDASFKHEKAKYPGVIIEVCYSQKFRAAADLADDYILDTNGNVKLVIALNIEYRGSKKATLSIWRPEDIIVDGVEELRAIAKVEELVHSLAIAKLEELDTDSCSLFEQHLDTQLMNQPKNLRCSWRFGTLVPRAFHRNTPTSIRLL